MNKLLLKMREGGLMLYERAGFGLGREVVPAGPEDLKEIVRLVKQGALLDQYPEMLEVMYEFCRAKNLHPNWKSSHEGWALIKEELDELWDEIRRKEKDQDFFQMRTEAMQVAAMGIRFMIDICRKKEEDGEGNVGG